MQGHLGEELLVLGVLLVIAYVLGRLGKLIGLPDVSFTQLDAGQKTAIASIAAGFAGLISLFNIGGRFFWASLSDRIGRKEGE